MSSADPNTVRGQLDAIQTELDEADVTGFFDRIDAHLAHIRHLLDEAPTTNCHIEGFRYRIVFDGHDESVEGVAQNLYSNADRSIPWADLSATVRGMWRAEAEGRS